MYLSNVDYTLLREQKEVLIALAQNFDTGSINGDALEGVIAFLDATQDYAVDILGRSEEEVFGVESEGTYVSNTMVSKASQFLIADEHSVKAQLRAIIKQSEIDSTELIDNLDEVQVWEMVEFRFSCEAFLKYIK